MQLLMTVPQRVARVVCNKIDLNGAKRHHVNDVLLQPAEPLVADPRNLKCVAMQMQRMLIAAAITENKPVALACMDREWLNLGPRFVIDRPRVELRSLLRADVAKRQHKFLVR